MITPLMHARDDIDDDDDVVENDSYCLQTVKV